MSKDASFDYQNNNYPLDNDTTSEGGYGVPDTFSPQNQRRADPQSQPGSDTGLIDQSLDGGSLKRQVQDAQQGTDSRARADFANDARRDFDALNPYGRNPDSRDEMSDHLASAHADQRARQYESGAAAGNDGDAGAV